MGTQKNRLNETVLLSTQNICLNWWVRKYLRIYKIFMAHLTWIVTVCLSICLIIYCHMYMFIYYIPTKTSLDTTYFLTQKTQIPYQPTCTSIFWFRLAILHMLPKFTLLLQWYCIKLPSSGVPPVRTILIERKVAAVGEFGTFFE